MEQLIPASVGVLLNGDVIIAGNGRRPKLFPTTTTTTTGPDTTAGNATLLLLPGGKPDKAKAYLLPGNVASAKASAVAKGPLLVLGRDFGLFALGRLPISHLVA